MTPDSTPNPADRPRIPADRPVEMDGHRMHELRNELSTAMMAAAVARRLLETGRHEEALVNLRRVESACGRCAGLLNTPPGTRLQ